MRVSSAAFAIASDPLGAGSIANGEDTADVRPQPRSIMPAQDRSADVDVHP